MKKDDESLKGQINEEEELFDLSLDDLEPEDVIIEPHVDEADEEVIDLIELVEKGDIDLAEEDLGSITPLENIQEPAEDSGHNANVEESLDLLDISLDHDLEMDALENFKKEDADIDAIEIGKEESDLFIGKDTDQSPELSEGSEVFFNDLADESAFKELTADENVAIENEPEVEDRETGISDMPSETPIEDKTMEIYPGETEIPEPVYEILAEEPEKPLEQILEELTIAETPAVQQDLIPEKEESPQVSPSAVSMPGISEEKIEAILRKVVEDVFEKMARETMKEVMEKAARDTMAELSEKISKETTEMIERSTKETMTNVSEKINRETTEMVERVAKETITNVAEKIITDAINILQTSIESSSHLEG